MELASEKEMPHYYDEKQEGAVRPFRVTIRARNEQVELWSGSGVFSKNVLDKGTQLLLEKCILEPGWRVHDLGCGIGIVGIIVQRACPSCTVLCSDVSERAVMLTKRNVRELKLGMEVRKSDGYAKIPEKFDTILLNPPYVAGREVVFKLIDEAYEHLVDGGLLQVVARHQKGGEMIRRKLVELFGNCDDSRKGSGYRVYVAKR